jgi:hypothetical protein
MNSFQGKHSFHAATNWCTYKNEKIQTHSFKAFQIHQECYCTTLLSLSYSLFLSSIPQYSHFSFTVWWMRNMLLTVGPVTSESTLIIPNTFHLCTVLIFRQYWTQFYVMLMWAITWGLNSTLSTVTRLWAGLPSNHGSTSGRGKIFSLPWLVKTGLGGSPNFLSSPGQKYPRHEAAHLPP